MLAQVIAKTMFQADFFVLNRTENGLITTIKRCTVRTTKILADIKRDICLM